MPRLIFKNNFEVALAQPTTTSDTTITIRSGSGFPTLGANERVVATIVDAATGLQFEIVTVTAVVGNVLTVQRAQEGTAARAWAAGDMLSIRTTAATLTNTERNFGAIPSGINLNALTGSWFGKYFQEGNANASPSLNYPVQKAGVLEVLQTGVLTESCVQRYSVWDSGIIYARAYSAESQTWFQWRKIYTDKDVIPIANGGTGQTTVQGMKTAFGFGSVADQDIVPTSMGGTGSGDNAQAWLNIRPQGSTPLSGDPVNDYDATTKRWVENLVNTGTVGPSMNGVMNYGVGDFHLRDSRAYIQPYEVVADGQLLNRADWPELWAYAQMLSPIADADWLADPAKRGKYSLGNGTTTFRVPDRNGVQTGSIQALFGRGDGGNSGDDGVIFAAAAPNIIGEIPSFYGFQAAAYDNASGALGMNGKSESTPMNQWNASHPGVSASFDINFRASRSSPVYGRNSITDNILPRNFVGVWVIRASGGFVAANTQWAVINGDSTAPSVGTVVRGGRVISEYDVSGAKKYSAELLSQAEYGTGKATAILRITDHITGVTKDLFLDMNGTLTVTGNVNCSSVVNGVYIDSTGIGYGGGLRRLAQYAAPDSTSVNQVYYVENNASKVACYQVTIPGVSYQHVWRLDHDGVNEFFSIRSDKNMYTPLGQVAIQGSDVRIKENFEKPKEGAWDRVKAIGICEFKYKGQHIVQRGFLAQQMGDIDPIYTFEGGTAHDDEGKEFEILNVNDKAVLADVITVMQMMQDKIETLESQMAELKAAK